VLLEDENIKIDLKIKEVLEVLWLNYIQKFMIL